MDQKAISPINFGYAVGDRVRVKIRDSEGWVSRAVDSMDGAIGKIAELRHRYGGWRALIHFEKPCEPWHSYQAPVTAFWFEVEDLCSALVSW